MEGHDHPAESHPPVAPAQAARAPAPKPAPRPASPNPPALAGPQRTPSSPAPTAVQAPQTAQAAHAPAPARPPAGVNAAIVGTIADTRPSQRTSFPHPREENISREVYRASVDGVTVPLDLRLPSGVSTQFDRALPDLARKSETKEDLLEGIRLWSREHMKDWEESGDYEHLSLATAANKKTANCTMRAGLLYALALRARDNLKGKRGANLDDVKFGFKQVSKQGDIDHVCMTATAGGKRKDYDPSVAEGRQHGDNFSVPIGLPEFVATISYNKGGYEMEKLKKRGADPVNPTTEAYYRVAEALAPKNAFVAMGVAKLAQRLYSAGKADKAKEYADKAIWMMRGAQADPAHSGWNVLNDSKREKMIAALNDISHNLKIGVTVAQASAPART